MKHIMLVMPVVALALTLISSCVMIMESGEDGRSVIYVECIQGMSDTTAITVMATAPKFGYEKSRVLSDVDVTLNGRILHYREDTGRSDSGDNRVRRWS